MRRANQDWGSFLIKWFEQNNDALCNWGSFQVVLVEGWMFCSHGKSVHFLLKSRYRCFLLIGGCVRFVEGWVLPLLVDGRLLPLSLGGRAFPFPVCQLAFTCRLYGHRWTWLSRLCRWRPSLWLTLPSWILKVLICRRRTFPTLTVLTLMLFLFLLFQFLLSQVHFIHYNFGGILISINYKILFSQHHCFLCKSSEISQSNFLHLP